MKPEQPLAVTWKLAAVPAQAVTSSGPKMFVGGRQMSVEMMSKSAASCAEFVVKKKSLVEDAALARRSEFTAPRPTVKTRVPAFLACWA